MNNVLVIVIENNVLIIEGRSCFLDYPLSNSLFVGAAFKRSKHIQSHNLDIRTTVIDETN